MRDTERARNGTSDVYASAPPLASSVTVPDPTEAPVQALEVVKNVNVTVPVGVPKLPLTVALSCTVDPAGTDVTTASHALRTALAARLHSAVTPSRSKRLSVPGQLGFPV